MFAAEILLFVIVYAGKKKKGSLFKPNQNITYSITALKLSFGLQDVSMRIYYLLERQTLSMGKSKLVE